MKIFITGGTTGIGFTLAKDYLEEGHTVGICGRDLSKLPIEYQNHVDLKSYQFSVTDKNAFRVALDNFALYKEKGLDIMIANAGISLGRKNRIPNFEKNRQILETNIWGTHFAFELALSYFLPAKSGQLVAISSVAGEVGLPGAGAYSASKACITKMCESLSIDLAAENISVTCIAPGFIDTPLTKTNDHSMPFIMSSKKASQLIRQAIAKKKVWVVFPCRMILLITLLKIMPRKLYHYIMKLPFLNYSRG